MSERWLWTQKEDIGPSPRYGHAMAYEAARQRVVLFGGLSYPAPTFNDTWEWDGGAWTQVSDMGDGRYFAGMTYDESRQRLVLFGGFAPQAFGQAFQESSDTWEWDGTEWTQVADIGPPRRRNVALTYDTVRQRSVLFGGYDGSSANKWFADTWEWDGTEWTQIADTGPSGRSSPAMVFDSSRECLVLFGGYVPSPGWLGDTWEWSEDTGWVKRQDMGPRSISTPTMVRTERRTVLFGAPQGESGAGYTWEWNGRLWTQRQNMGPPARTAHALAYDRQRDRMVLFGGWRYSSGTTPLQQIQFGDTWELAIIEQ